MARRFAQFPVSQWTVPSYTLLTREQQHTLFMLTTQAKISLCGVIDYIPGRLVLTAADWTPESLDESIRWLAAHDAQWLVVDDMTQEILVRNFIRDDLILGTPNVAQGMAAQFGEVMSPTLQEAIIRELRDLYAENPSGKGWEGVRRGNPVLMDRVLETNKKEPLRKPLR